MKAKDLKKILSEFNDNEEIGFIVFDEYNCEVEGVKFKGFDKGYKGFYLKLSAYNE